MLLSVKQSWKYTTEMSVTRFRDDPRCLLEFYIVRTTLQMDTKLSIMLTNGLRECDDDWRTGRYQYILLAILDSW